MGILSKEYLIPPPATAPTHPAPRPRSPVSGANIQPPGFYPDLANHNPTTDSSMTYSHPDAAYEGSLKMEMDLWSSKSPAMSCLPPSSSTSPPPPPKEFYQQPPRTRTSSGPPLCAGCSLRIVDKFYLCAVETKWHTACLKCAECGVELENQQSCYERDGNIYCKDDYVKMFANKCYRCMGKISTSDLVMKARHCLFHVDCFRCGTCDASLKKGDLFGMLDEVPYCQAHYEPMNGHPLSVPPPPPGSYTSDHMNHSPVDGRDFPPPPHGMGAMGYPPSFPPPPGSDGGPPPPGWFPGPPCTASEFPVGSDFAYDNNNEPRLKKQRGRKKRKVETFAAMNGYLEAGGYPPGVDGPNGGKTKRARTSFKHHQLRIMKAHFQINQNPDSRELKMLSQKTQLDKKVLQVWFQNARAKWRRTKAQDTSGTGGMMGPGGIQPAANSSSSGMSGPEDAELAGASPCSDSSGAMIPCC